MNIYVHIHIHTKYCVFTAPFMPLVLCQQVVSQAPQYCKSSEVFQNVLADWTAMRNFSLQQPCRWLDRMGNVPLAQLADWTEWGMLHCYNLLADLKNWEVALSQFARWFDSMGNVAQLQLARWLDKLGWCCTVTACNLIADWTEWGKLHCHSLQLAGWLDRMENAAVTAYSLVGQDGKCCTVTTSSLIGQNGKCCNHSLLSG